MSQKNNTPNYLKRLLFIGLLGIIISGCTPSLQVQFSPLEQDKIAKSFQIYPGRANLYLMRDEQLLAKEGVRIIINDTEIGTLASDTYLLTRAKPEGIYELKAELLGKLYTQKLNVKLNQNYFIQIVITDLGGQSKIKFLLVNEINGRASIVKLKRVASTLVNLAKN